MRLLLLLCLLAVPVWAQGKPKKNVPQFSPPDPGKKDKDEDDDAAGGTTDALKRAIEKLSGFPNERARRAAEQLIVRREKSLPMVLDVLMSENPRVAHLKPGAAYVIGRIGDKSHSLTLLLIASEKPQHKHAEVFLEAAYRLDPEKAVAEAFRFFRLSETTLRREAAQFVRDRITKKNLPAVLHLLDKKTADRAFTREIGLTLLDRLVQTGEADWKVAGELFYRTLGDDSPQVASRAMRILASLRREDNIAALNGLITKKYSYWRQRSYAALSLSIMSSAFKVQPFADETIEYLKGPRGLQHPKEMLVKASSALALGEAALRTGDKELVRLLDKVIPVVLIEAVGAGNRHYRDFGSVMPLAYTMLRKITGQVLPDHAPRWAQWWKDNGRRFRARRELREIEAADIDDTVIELRLPKDQGAARVRFSVVAESRPTFAHGRAYALPNEDMTSYVRLLREAGFFAAAEQDPAQLKNDAALVVVRVGDLARTVGYPLDSDGIRDRIIARAKNLAILYSWQLWWDRRAQPSWALFFGETRKWFVEHDDRAARADRLRDMVADSLDDLLLFDLRMRAVRTAAELPGGGKALGKRHVEAFLESVRIEREPNEYVAAVLDLLVPDAGPEATKGMIDALEAQPGPRALALLTRLCSKLKPEALTVLAGDPRWKVRRSAVEAVAELDTADATTILAKRLKDDEEQVRAAAAVALAKRKDKRALGALAKLSTSESSESRAVAAFGYGLLGGETAMHAVRPLLYRDTDLRVRTRAIDGLVEGADAAATNLLLGVFERETDSTVRAAASHGLVKLETPALVRRLMARLQHTPAASPERVAIVNVLARFESSEPVGVLQAVLQGDDLLSADAAALGLARRWNDSAVGQLIRMAENGRNPRAAVRHLQIVSSWSNPAESFKEQASSYKGWYKVNSTGRPMTWFSNALSVRGYDTTPLRGMIEDSTGASVPAVTDEAVPLLLRVLRDKQWYLRRNASFLLARRIGAAAPDLISYDTLGDEQEKLIAKYNDWWAAYSARKDKERRG